MNFREFVTGRRPSARSRILQYWQTLRPDLPLIVQPISKDHEGSTKTDDGIRLTGSPQFIASVISRLKELLAYESPNTKIEVIYKQSESQKSLSTKPSYIMYIQVRERSRSSRRPKPPGIGNP